MTRNPKDDSMRRDTRYLEWHGAQWRVRIKVPAKLRPVVGKAHLVAPLHTDSLAKANVLKWSVIGQLKAKLADAERGGPTGDPLVQDALWWRARIAEDDAAAKRGALDPERTVLAGEMLAERAEEVEKRQGHARAAMFAAIASGQETPISTYLDTWTAEKGFDPKVVGDHCRAVRRLEDWLRRTDQPQTIEGITRKVAGRFVSEDLAPGMEAKTTNKYISSLKTYWTWLERKGHAEANPWDRQSVSGVQRHRVEDDSGKRPYTDAELVQLLSGETTQRLHDMMRISALSGLRIDEIARLRVQDCKGGYFDVRKGKTAAGQRRVPVHSALASIIERRTSGRPGDAFLIEELGAAPSPTSQRTRSGKVTAEFTRYRRDLKLDERPGDKRQSNIDFHSFRRWFIAKAGEALETGAVGYTPWTIADVVGHDKEESLPLPMTMGRYPGPSGDAARRACVEAVALPKLPSADPKTRPLSKGGRKPRRARD